MQVVEIDARQDSWRLVKELVLKRAPTAQDRRLANLLHIEGRSFYLVLRRSTLLPVAKYDQSATLFNSV